MIVSGDSMGELTMMFDQPRTATAVAVTVVELASFSKCDFVKVIQEFPESAMEFEKAIESYVLVSLCLALRPCSAGPELAGVETCLVRVVRVCAGCATKSISTPPILLAGTTIISHELIRQRTQRPTRPTVFKGVPIGTACLIPDTLLR